MDDLSRQGVEHFNAGRFENALTCFRAAGDQGPETRVLLAHALNALARPDEAVAAFTVLITEFARHLPAYSGLANVLLHRSPARYPEAERILLGLLTLMPDGAASRENLLAALRASGQAFRALGDLESAEKTLARLAALGGGDRDSRRQLVDVLHRRAQSHLSADRLKEAEKLLRRILVLEPGHSDSRRGLVNLLRRRAEACIQAGRLVPAKSALRAALLLSPRDARSRSKLDGFERMISQAATARRAIAARSKAAKVRLFQRNRQLLRRGEDLIAAGRLDPAVSVLRKAIRLQPSAAPTRRRLAEALFIREFKRHLKGATESARGAPRLAGMSDELRLQLARIATACAGEHLARGRVKASRYSLRRALALTPGNADIRREIARVLRARIISQDVPNTRSHLHWARRGWEAVAKIDPRDGSSHLSLSLLMRWIGRPDQERAALRRAVAKGRELNRTDRFKALMRLGRYAEAIQLAENLLDQELSLTDFRAFSDPWEKDNRPDRLAPQTDLSALDRGLKSTPGPWRQFYLGCLGGPHGLEHFDALPAGARYRWMHYNAAMESLFSGSFRRAIRSFNIALRDSTLDWRAHGYLSEAYVCVGEPARARREMARSLKRAPEDERAQVYAWWGELELWLGGYARALELTSRACVMGAPFAHGWKGAALLKLGRKAEALAQLELALKLYPKDAEALLWRAEAKRELGRPASALKDLEGAGPERMVWILFNHALAKHALGDERAMRSDFDHLPVEVTSHVRRRLGLSGDGPLDTAAIVRVLEAGLKLGRGFRRAEYAQAVWLNA